MKYRKIEIKGAPLCTSYAYIKRPKKLSDSVFNIFNVSAKKNLQFILPLVFPFLGMVSILVYLFDNRISPSGVTFGEGLSFILSAIYASLMIFLLFSVSFLLVVFISLIFDYLSLPFEYIKEDFKGSSGGRCAIKKVGFYALCFVFFESLIGFLLWYFALVADILNSTTISTALVFLMLFISFLVRLIQPRPKNAVAIVDAFFFFFIFVVFGYWIITRLLIAPNQSFSVSYDFLEKAKIFTTVFSMICIGALLHLSIKKIAYVIEVRKKGLEAEIQAYQILVVSLGIIFFLIFGMPQGTYPWISKRIAQLIGIAADNATLSVTEESFKGYLAGTDEEGLSSCEGDGVQQIVGVDVIWYGLGDTIFFKNKFTNEKFEIKKDSMLLLKKTKDLVFCKKFSGVFFKSGTTVPEGKYEEINSYIDSLKNRFSNSQFSVEVEWQADPLPLRTGNYLLSLNRAGHIANNIKIGFCGEEVICRQSISAKIVGRGAEYSESECKDWPVKATKNECLAKNRGGKITVYVKNS